jgi:hypothetical protein
MKKRLPDFVEPATVMICRFPYGGQEHPDVADWLVSTVVEMKSDARIKEIMRFRVDDTPITMGRNRALKRAKQANVDFLLMIDADMCPDAYLQGNPYAIHGLPGAKPFWKTSFDFLWKQREKGEPSVIAAPYCGPPPLENIYVFHWETRASDVPEDDANISLEQFDRWTAYHMTGITEVGALPTGLFLMDMRALDTIDPPYTYYEHDKEHTEKHSTEDVTFTRDMAMRGVKMFCNWDAWAGHWKHKCVGKPHIISSAQVGQKFEDAVRKKYNMGPGEVLIEVGNGKGHSGLFSEAERQGEVQQHRLPESVDRRAGSGVRGD